MEIENNHLSTLARQALATGAERDPASENRAGQAAPRGAPDSVSLTPVAQLLREAESHVASEPVVDAQRVGATRLAIADGSFNIDPARIADRMMGMEQTLARLQ